MRVLALIGRVAVGVQVLDYPKVEPRWRGQLLERAHDREASALVAVDTADDEQLLGAARIAKFERVDATIFDRTPDQQGERMRARGQGKQQRGQCRDGGLHDRSGSSAAAE